MDDFRHFLSYGVSCQILLIALHAVIYPAMASNAGIVGPLTDSTGKSLPRTTTKATIHSFKSLVYETDEWAVLKDHYQELEQLALFLQRYPELTIELRGHTDDIGQENYNLRLSEQRAEEVARFLIWHGVDSARVSSMGFGSSMPKTEVYSPESRAENRRVEFIISYKDSPMIPKDIYDELMKTLLEEEDSTVNVKIIRKMEIGELEDVIASSVEMRKYIDIEADGPMDERPGIPAQQSAFITQYLNYNFDEAFAMLFRLTALKGLDLRAYQLDSIPEKIGRLTQLEVLGIGDNLLTGLPGSFARLQALEVLDMGGNRFTKVPEEIGELKNLKKLRLDWNPLQELSPNFDRLQQLEELNLWRSVKDPENFDWEKICSLNKLKVLKLTDNALTSLPDCICRMPALTTLQLNQNQLRELPDQFLPGSQLEYLSLIDNRLEKLPPSLSNLKHLKEIGLQHNPDLDLGDAIHQLSRLPELRKFSIHRMAIDSPGALYGLTQISTLSLTACEIEELPAGLEDLQNLEYLNLKSNRLSVLPEAISKLVKLKTLDVSYNELKALPPYLKQLTHLKVLILSGNHFTPGQIAEFRTWFPDCEVIP